MAYEEEIIEIVDISSDIEKLMERINEFSYLIETDDVYKMQKQVKTLRNTSSRIIAHLSSLSSIDDIKAYMDKKQKENIKEVRAQKVALLLQNTNFLEMNSLNFANITNEDLVAFQEYYNVTLSECGYGSWRWLQVWYNDHHITEEDMIKLGIRKEENCDNVKVESKVEITPKEDNPYDHFGWISPTGIFTPSDWGNHEESAEEIINQKGWNDEYINWEKPNGAMRLSRDFLIYEKGYVLVHNPSCDGGIIVTAHKNQTKAQREILFDYLTYNGDSWQAKQYLMDENI